VGDVAGELVALVVLDPEGLRHGGLEIAGLSAAGEAAEPDAALVAELVDEAPRHLHRQAGLADPGRAGEGDEPRASGQGGAKLLTLPPPSDERISIQPGGG